MNYAVFLGYGNRPDQALKETKNKQSKAEISPVEWILLEHELNLYSHQSEDFAEKIVKAFKGGEIKKHRTGAHQAGFFVLVGSFMPAVLFEMGFITNQKDRKYMSSTKGQKDIASRLSKAIADFFRAQKK
ncbi:N-acetylmuramoyl-L-alanine amidase [Fibrobacterota bacterium]